MNLFKNISTFINHHVLGYRYDFVIKNYFLNDPVNNAITTLYKEGYPVTDKFEELKQDYLLTYRELNMEERFFLLELSLSGKNKEILNFEKIRQNHSYLNINFTFIANDLNSRLLQFKFESQMKIYIARSDIFSKEIERIIPVYKAVIVRKFAKLLEEKIILKHKDIFSVDNYEPNPEKLKRYKESLRNLNYDDIADKLDIIINEIESKNKGSCSKKDKKKGEIKCQGNDPLNKIHNILDKIRRYCNNIIHFDPSKNVKFNLNDSLLSEDFNMENNNNSDNKNEIKNEDGLKNKDEDLFIIPKKTLKEVKEKNENPKEYFVHISKIIDYIAQINLPNQLSEELSKLEIDINKNLGEMEEFLRKDINIRELINFDLYERHKNEILLINDFVQKNTKNIPEFIKDFNKAKIRNILEYINSHPYDCNQIKIEKCNKREKDILTKINTNLRQYDEYSRIKFNLTLERDLELLELKNKVTELLNRIKSVDSFLERLNQLKIGFINKYESLNIQVSLIESCLIVFDYKRIFTEISPEIFVKELKKDFNNKNDKIDIFSKEISNTKLFLYLLKANLYDEKAFKSTQGIDENYIK